jgi:hypothetical protein
VNIPPDYTPERLLELAEKFDAESKRYAAMAAACREHAAALQRLPEGRADRTMSKVDVDTRDHEANVKRGASRATRRHPGLRRIYEAGHTVTSLAKELRETRARVSSWFAEGENNRPIPKHQVDYLEKKYGIPRASWRRIAE